jgi:hypothetical protein
MEKQRLESRHGGSIIMNAKHQKSQAAKYYSYISNISFVRQRKILRIASALK